MNNQVNVTMLRTNSNTPTSAGQTRCLMKDMLSAQVGTPAMAHIDREITPLIAELATLGPGNNKHPTAKQLFKWLTEPHRSAEEFTYVIGPLEQHVCGIMMNHFKHHVTISFRRGCKFVGKIAAEALAKRYQILTGPWETAGWFLGNLNKTYNDNFSRMNHGYASERFGNWIINAIGDPERCPSSYLRIELIHLLIMLVHINDSNRYPVLNSIMSAFSSLNMDYLIGGNDTGFFNMKFNTIIDTLEFLASKKLRKCVYEFDEKVVQKLKSNLNIRLLVIVNDVACNYSMNPSKYSEPSEIKTLTALFKTTNDCIKLEWKHFHEEINYDSRWTYLEPLSRAVNVLIKSFKGSVETPQLNELTALCVIDLLELVILKSVALWDDQRNFHDDTLSNNNEIIEKIFILGKFSPNSPDSSVTLGSKIICHDKRLRILEEKWQNIVDDDFPNYEMITFLFHNIDI